LTRLKKLSVINNIAITSDHKTKIYQTKSCCIKKYFSIYRQKIRTLNIKIWNTKIEFIEYILSAPFKLPLKLSAI